MEINGQWLATFRVLVQEQSFTRTAHKRHMTQPGVSQQVKKLEALVDQPLLVRVGKGFELTVAGEELYRYALERAESERRLLGRLSQDDPEAGPCRLALSGSLALALHGVFLDHQQRHPGLSVEVEAAPNHRIIESVADGRVALGVVTELPDAHRFDVLCEGCEALALALPRRFGRRLPDRDALMTLGLIDHPDAPYYLRRVLDQIDPDFPVEGLPRRGYINQLHQILLPVSRGLGFTALPASAVAAFVPQGRIATAALAEPVYEPLYLIRRRQRPLPARYDWFIRAIGEHISG